MDVLSETMKVTRLDKKLNVETAHALTAKNVRVDERLSRDTVIIRSVKRMRFRRSRLFAHLLRLNYT